MNWEFDMEKLSGTNATLNILSLEDSLQDFEIIRELLTDAGINLKMDRVDKEHEFVSMLHRQKYDLILADFNLLEYDAFSALKKSTEIVPEVPFIVVSGSIGEETAIEFIRQGAVDYILKNKPEKLPFAVKRAIDEAQEIKTRKLTEQSLRESESKYRNLYENSISGFFRTSPDGRLLEVNSTCAKMFGYSSPEEIMTEITDVSIQLYADNIHRIEVIRLLTEKGTIEARECEAVRRDGSKFWMLLAAREVRDKNGVLLWYEGTNLDITKRKNTEFELLESNELNRLLLKSIPFGMHIVDEQGNILFQSESMMKFFDGQAVGKKCWQVYRDDKTQCIDCPLLSGINIGITEDYESDGVFGGKTFMISHTGMMFQGRKAILEIFQDISVRKQVENELITAKEKAEESDRLKSAFLANMSHELRTPLNSIIGFSELMADPEYDPAQQQKFARMINVSGNNLFAIMSDIMDISKIQAGQLHISKQVFSVNHFIADLHNEFVFKAIEKGIEFRLDVSNPKHELLIKTDIIKLRQILTNFISNALKFTKEGFIEIGFKTLGEFVQFHIRDTGIGISKEFHEQIFERFCQVESALNRRYGGNGLGLAISKSLVELLGGAIWLESEQGVGSTFYFLIPVSDEQSIEPKDLITSRNDSLH